jgi:HlyD family secretion protein
MGRVSEVGQAIGNVLIAKLLGLAAAFKRVGVRSPHGVGRRIGRKVIVVSTAFAFLLRATVRHLVAIFGWTSVAPTRPTSGIGAQRAIATHLIAIALIAAVFIGTIGAMSATTELSGAVITTGSLVVESNVKKVQHPAGGVVGELLVSDGSLVRSGDLLIRLDPTEARANLAAITKTVWELTARQARLETERDSASELRFPADLLQAAADPEIGHITIGERRLFDLRREALAGQKAQLHERITQLNDEIKGLSEQITAKGEEIELIQKELVGVRDLWTRNLIPIARLVALERDGARLKGERGQLVATIAQSRGKISEIQLQILQLDQNIRSEVAKELGDIRAKMAELVERRVTATQELQRIDLRATQSGFVHQLAVHTKGGVIGAGEQIMLIVPCVDGSELASAFFTFAALVGAAMCSAFRCGSHDRWP